MALTARLPTERLRLYMRKAEQLEQSSVVRSGRLYSFSVSWTSETQALRLALSKPDFEALQTYILTIRDFDNPKDDLYIPAIVASPRLANFARVVAQLSAGREVLWQPRWP